jgi:ASPIC and UnbV/FG-GAP-like repeat
MKSRYLIYFFIILLYISCKKKIILFEQIPSSHSGIHFNNKIIENDSINPLDMINVYNGGGVGIGDFNNDGLQDIYFTGNQVSNKLYLNKGNFKFEDVTDIAKVGGEGRWCRGVSVIDINNDGLLDLYVCVAIASDSYKRQNLLYVNQGIDKNGFPHFKEMAAEYGLNDTTYSTMATFFDYDNDGDLDMYLSVNENIPSINPNVYRPIITNGTFPSTGRLYRNDFNARLNHPVFTNVSKQAGILTEGYSHAATIADINMDGWKDIYVTNDFLTDDILYINNHDGTFTDRSKEYFKHTSATAMGQDIVDINNDGLADVIALDMNPENNYRKKMMMGSNSYQSYINFDLYGYQYQYVHNTLQLNQGQRVGNNDSIGPPAFSGIGFLSGISQTDWSWTPLVTDFNNDGNRDIIITNGYPKDVTDHDFMAYRQKAYTLASKQDILAQIPEVKIHNYAFMNNGDLTFSDVSEKWGLTAISFSNGAAYADLDNDGDMDVVINNINDEAMIYKNTSRETNKTSSNYLQIKFEGSKLNVNGLGAFAELHYDKGKQQVWENTPYRGYLSSDQDVAHFGLGKIRTVDSVIIKWPNGKMQILQNVKANQLLKVNIKNALLNYSFAHNSTYKNALFKEVNDSVNIHYVQQEKDFVDFYIQRTLPHKFSEYNPSLAVGDIDGNGLDDIVVGGSYDHSAQLFLQQPNGKFMQKSLLKGKDTLNKNYQDEGILLFDADGDGDLDLYITSGGYQAVHNDPSYQDKLYLNDGKGNFTEDTTALPKNYTSKFCVRAIDYDKDGDLDLFVSGRVDPANYPKPVSSFIFRNDTKNGRVKFTDVTDSVAPALKNIGMVSDALFTDFNNDGWPDLILVGEWMPVTFLENDKGIFKDVTKTSGVGNNIGWWSSIAAGDFNNDGKMDYILGNLGKNSFFKASDQYPVNIISKDFDDNGTYDAFISVYLPASQKDTEKKEFPEQSRDDILKQMISIRKRFETYKSFANATIDSLFTKEQLKGALKMHANYFSSAFLKNDGNRKFTMTPLPVQAQISVLNAMSVGDFDGDGNLDVAINGNDYGTEPSLGRYDALDGLVMKGDGKGNFKPQSILQSGIYIPGNGKAFVSLRSSKGKYLLAASQNKGPLKIFELNESKKFIPLQPFDESAVFFYKNGQKQKRETGYGSSFLSQSGRFLTVDQNAVSVEIKNNKGLIRKISFQ